MSCLFEMYVDVVFVIRCLYSAVSLTLVREQRLMMMMMMMMTTTTTTTTTTTMMMMMQETPLFGHNNYMHCVGTKPFDDKHFANRKLGTFGERVWLSG